MAVVVWRRIDRTRFKERPMAANKFQRLQADALLTKTASADNLLIEPDALSSSCSSRSLGAVRTRLSTGLVPWATTLVFALFAVGPLHAQVAKKLPSNIQQ